MGLFKVLQHAKTEKKIDMLHLLPTVYPTNSTLIKLQQDPGTLAKVVKAVRNNNFPQLPSEFGIAVVNNENILNWFSAFPKLFDLSKMPQFSNPELYWWVLSGHRELAAAHAITSWKHFPEYANIVDAIGVSINTLSIPDPNSEMSATHRYEINKVLIPFLGRRIETSRVGYADMSFYTRGLLAVENSTPSMFKLLASGASVQDVLKA